MAAGRDILLKVKNFLFGIVNREFLIFCCLLALSGAFWLLMTLNEPYEYELSVAVRVEGVPKNVVLTSDDTDTLKVTVSDKGTMILGYIYAKTNLTVGVSFQQYVRHSGVVSVPAADIQKRLSKLLYASTRIVSLKPDRLDFTFNYGLCRRLPIQWTGNVVPENLYFLSRVDYEPDSVTVYAAPQVLDTMKCVYTEPLNQTDFRDSLVVNCRLQKIRGVKCVPNRVKIRFLTDVLTEERIADIPIEGVNLPEGKVLRTFPSKVAVRFVTGLSQFRNLTPADFTVVVDYNDIAAHPSDKCTLYLRHVPAGVSRAALELQQVDYLIEEE